MALVLVTLHVNRQYLVRQRVCVAARHAAWKAAQTGRRISADEVRAVTRRDGASLAFAATGGRSGFGAGPIAESLDEVLGDAPGFGGDASQAAPGGAIPGVPDFLSIDATCEGLDDDPRATVSVTVGRMGPARGGTIVRTSRLVRDVWYTQPDDEGLFGFFLGPLLSGISPFELP